MVDYLDMNKELNMICICNERLSKFNNEEGLSMIYPCEHIIHTKCCKIIKDKCGICNKKINGIHEDYKIEKMTSYNPIFKQQHIDIQSMKPLYSRGNFSILRAIMNSESYIQNSMSVLLSEPDNRKEMFIRMLNSGHIVIKEKGTKYMKSKVFIAHHFGSFDAIPILAHTDCAFVTLRLQVLQFHRATFERNWVG